MIETWLVCCLLCDWDSGDEETLPLGALLIFLLLDGVPYRFRLLLFASFGRRD